MSIEPHGGRELPPELAFLSREPAAVNGRINGLRVPAEATAPRDVRNVPVAKLAARPPKVTVEPIDDEPEAWFPRELRKGLAASVVGHVLLLLIMAVWTISYGLTGMKTLETRLGGGSLAGSELGDQLTGGLGMDEPLALPKALDVRSVETQPALTAFKLSNPLSNEAPGPRRDAEGAQNGGGIALSGTGEAGSGDGFGVARFGSGSENIKGVDVKVGDPQFTLIWDGRADIDLHVQEPGGSDIFWNNTQGKQGGELDVDNRTGPGPENVYWVQGLGPPGVYRWYVEYYGPAPFEDYTGPIHWRVRVKHGPGEPHVYEGVLRSIKERSKVRALTLDERKPRSGPPG